MESARSPCVMHERLTGNSELSVGVNGEIVVGLHIYIMWPCDELVD